MSPLETLQRAEEELQSEIDAAETTISALEKLLDRLNQKLVELREQRAVKNATLRAVATDLHRCQVFQEELFPDQQW